MRTLAQTSIGAGLRVLRGCPLKRSKLMPGEGQLPLGVAGRVQFRQTRRLSQGYAAVEMRDEMRDAMRAHHRKGGIEAPRMERRGFLQRARLEHGVEAPVNSRLQRFSLRREENREDILCLEKRRRTRGVKRDKTFAGCLENLEGA